jgi:transposase
VPIATLSRQLAPGDTWPVPARRFGLRDEQWERIKDLLAGREGSVGVTASDNRLFVEAVLDRYRTGMPWRDLPERFDDGTKVHLRFSRWAKSGVWERVFQHLAQTPTTNTR